VASDATEEQRLRRLIEAGRALASDRDLEAVLADLVEVARDLTGARHGALLDADAPAADPPPGPVLDAAVEIRGQTWGQLRVYGPRGGGFGALDRETAEAIAAWAAIAIDTARLREASEERQVELDRAVRELIASTDVARAVGGETDLERILGAVAKRGRALVEARSLQVLMREGDRLVVAAATGDVEREARGGSVPLEASAAGRVLKTLRPDREPDVLTVPVTFRGQPLGVIAAFDRLGDAAGFSEEDEDLLMSFAAGAATAVATAQSVEEDSLRRSLEAAERERGRWARELHDETLQGLGALRVLLASALRRGSAEAVHAAAREAVEQLADEIESLRRLISELRPAALDEIGLAAAIEGLAERSAAEGGFAVDIAVSLSGGNGAGPGRLGSEVENAVYRTVQEALTNVKKHAAAEHVEVRVGEAEGAVELLVRDDGRGFAPETEDGAGFGLLGMRERIAMAGGRIEVDSAPGEGTVVRAVLPG